MNTAILLLGGLVLLTLLMLSGLMLLQDIRREERFAIRVRMIHGHPPVPLMKDAHALRAAATRVIAAVGQAIARSGLVSGRTLAELETTLANAGLRGPQGVGIFIGCKILLATCTPVLVWLLVRHMQLSGMLAMLLPPAGGVIGLLAPEWLVRRMRASYLAKLEWGLPDALDMMVICAQAGLGLGPAVIRVASELRHAYREIALEFAQTANELQIMTDSRVALANLGTRTGLDSFKRLGTTLIQTIQYGTPLTDALRGLSAELRQEMLNRLEERAARLPVLLTLPMIIFILPCVFLIAGGPAMIQVMKAFSH